MAALIRWKLPLHGVPTTGTTTLTSAGGATNRFPAGRAVRLRRISGHRDTGATACPGDALYAQLPELRALVGDVRPIGTTTSLRGKVTAPRAVGALRRRRPGERAADRAGRAAARPAASRAPGARGLRVEACLGRDDRRDRRIHDLCLAPPLSRPAAAIRGARRA